MSYQYLNERERTGRLVNWHLLEDVEITDRGYPQMQPATLPDAVTHLVGFNEVLTDPNPTQGCVHFFLDDYQFDRVWRTPEVYVEQLERYPAALSPDFSLYTNYPVPLQQWDHYRNQLMGAWWQAQGLTVIPTVSWSDEASFAWCFDGLPEGGDAAVSTVGVLRQDETLLLFEHGLHAFIERKHPSRILLYGQMRAEIGAILCREGVKWRVFAHGQAERVKWRDKHGR
jgi:hypothetical protein